MGILERQQRVLRLVLFAALYLFFASLQARAESYVLDSVTEAEAFARNRIAEIRRAGTDVKKVELYHVGNQDPETLSVIARLFKDEGIEVAYKRVTKTEINAMIDEQGERLEPAVGPLYDMVNHGSDWSALKRKSARQHFREGVKRLKHFFGLTNGVSFMTYKQPRKLSEKLIEGGVALAKAAVTSFVLYHTLSERAAAGDHVNVWLPIVVNAAFSLGFDYWQRGNSAFKGQGTSFDYETGKFIMNRKFYLMTALMHSVIMREAIMAASHVTDLGFTMMWTHFFAAIATSGKGLLGKAPVEMAIERGRRSWGKWRTIAVMTMWGAFYSSLQLLDMFHGSTIFKDTLLVMGSFGLGFELWRERVSVAKAITRFQDWVLRKKRAQACETLLIYRGP